MAGSATFTMLVSSTIIRLPRQSVYSASQRACLSFIRSSSWWVRTPRPRTGRAGSDRSPRNSRRAPQTQPARRWAALDALPGRLVRVDLAVVVRPTQVACGGLVEQDGRVRVQLEHAGRAARRDGALHGGRDGVC